MSTRCSGEKGYKSEKRTVKGRRVGVDEDVDGSGWCGASMEEIWVMKVFILRLVAC